MTKQAHLVSKTTQNEAQTLFFLFFIAASLRAVETPTFLGLTVVGWAIAGASVAAAGVGYFFTRGKLADINDERAKGGIAAVTWSQIIAEAREFEKQAMIGILEELQAETNYYSPLCDRRGRNQW